MGRQTHRRFSLAVFTLAMLLSSAGLLAGTRVNVEGDLQTVTEQVENTFRELDIDAEGLAVTPEAATAIGRSRAGSRVTVAVQRKDDRECEVTITSESPADPEIEKRFLRMMQVR